MWGIRNAPCGICAKVYPSGLACTSSAAPSMPPAPGLLSTMTFRPSTLLALSASTRITTSVDPPAGHGQMYLIGLLGKACARTKFGASAVAATAALESKKSRRSVMHSLLNIFKNYFVWLCLILRRWLWGCNGQLPC